MIDLGDCGPDIAAVYRHSSRSVVVEPDFLLGCLMFLHLSFSYLLPDDYLDLDVYKFRSVSLPFLSVSFYFVSLPVSNRLVTVSCRFVSVSLVSFPFGSVSFSAALP